MDKELKKIKTEVDQITGTTSSSPAKKRNFDWKQNKKNILYTFLFFVLIFALFFFQPFFVMKTDEKDKNKKKISYSHLFIYAFVFTLIGIVSYELLENWKFLKI